MTSKPDIMSMTLPELTEFVKSLGEPQFRAKQLFSWMHSGTPIEDMTNLSKKFRERLLEEADYRLPTIEKKFVSKLDGTVKYLFALLLLRFFCSGQLSLFFLFLSPGVLFTSNTGYKSTSMNLLFIPYLSQWIIFCLII